jgi:hypothetical protein
MLVIMLLSHAGDNTAESCWRRRYRRDLAAARCRYQVMLATVLLGQLGHGAMYMPSHAGDNAAESC